MGLTMPHHHPVEHPGNLLLNHLNAGNHLVSVGVFNALSAAVACSHDQVQGLFLSGLGYTYSDYGWPDVGLIAPQDIRDACQVLRYNHPDRFLISDIDSGLGGLEQLRRICVELKEMGVSAVQLEDQTIDHKRCGHLDGKVLRPLDEALERLDIALTASGPMQVIARTDASLSDGEAIRRVDAFIEAGARIVLVDGINEQDLLDVIQRVKGRAHLMANIVGGGKLESRAAEEFKRMGVAIVNLSTALLFPAMSAMSSAMQTLIDGDFAVSDLLPGTSLKEANELMSLNYNRFVTNRRAA